MIGYQLLNNIDAATASLKVILIGIPVDSDEFDEIKGFIGLLYELRSDVQRTLPSNARIDTDFGSVSIGEEDMAENICGTLHYVEEYEFMEQRINEYLSSYDFRLYLPAFYHLQEVAHKLGAIAGDLKKSYPGLPLAGKYNPESAFTASTTTKFAALEGLLYIDQELVIQAAFLNNKKGLKYLCSG